MKHDPTTAAEFLAELYPRGPWLLTAIEPDRKGIATATFGPDKVQVLQTWLEMHASRNIYYSVNLPRGEMAQKADRSEIAEVCFLHVDVDPRAGEDLTKEQERIIKLMGDPPGGVPAPSYIISSGGGINALWRLEEPISLDGTLAAAESAKRYNLQLERIFGGDHCHNIDRILRLPGSVNWPNAKKRARGQAPAVARLLPGASRAVYPLSRFAPAAPVQGAGGSGFANPDRVVVPGNVARVSLEDLENVPEKVKVVIAQAADPDKPDRWKSRSEPLFWVVCELIRHAVSDEVIYSIITDPAFRISSSVLDKGSSSEKYAIRQIEQAHEVAIAPELAELNARHAVILNIGGKCRVVEEVQDPVLNRPRLSVQSFEDFRNAYLNRLIDISPDPDDPEKVRLGHWWLTHPKRRQFRSVVFSPERDAPESYNLWQGFSCEARPGVLHESFLKHIYDNICSRNEEHYKYLLGWLAMAVQHPGRPGEVAIVLRGTQGTGKSFFVKNFGRLWGRHFLHVSDSKHLVGHFNAHLRDCIILFGDEAFYAGDKRHGSILKTLVTEESITIEAKGRDMESSPNYVHLIMATNDEWAIPAGKDERRYFALDVAKSSRQDHAYFGAIDDDLKNGGLENLLYFLRTYDLTGFKVRNVPKTEALQDQKIRSLSAEEEWWFHKLEEGTIIRHQSDWRAPVLKEKVLDDYLLYSQRVGIQRRANATTLGRFLHRMCPSGPRAYQATHEVQDSDGRLRKERAYFYEFPPLEECRRKWTDDFGPYDWPLYEQRDVPRHPNAPPEDVF